MAWLAVAFAIALTLPIYLQVGKQTPEALIFNSFYNADFFKHIANTQSLALHGLPPQDLFAAGNPLYYYWLQYLLPAAVLDLDGRLEPAGVMLATIMLQMIFLLLVLYGVLREFGAGKMTASMTTIIGFCSLSFDGLAAWFTYHADDLTRIWSDINVESLDYSRLLGAPWHMAASSMLRLNLYVPQHQLAILIFLSWLLLTLKGNPVKNAFPRWVAFLPLPGISLPVGTIASLAMLATELAVSLRKHSGTIVPLLAFCSAWLGAWLFGIVGDNSLADPFVDRPFTPPPEAGLGLSLVLLQTFTSHGLVAFAGLAGLVLAYKKRNEDKARALLAIAAVTFVAMLVELAIDHPGLLLEIQLKTSFVVIPLLIIASGLTFESVRQHLQNRKPLLLLGLLFVLGLPTTIHDVYWHVSPASRWQVALPLADKEALQWVSRHTEKEAVFQQYPEPPFLLGGRDAWLPVFAGRGVAYAPRSPNGMAKRQDAEIIFQPHVPSDRRATAVSSLGVKYVYLSRALQAQDYDVLTERFDELGWARVFANRDVSIWRTDVASQ